MQVPEEEEDAAVEEDTAGVEDVAGVEDAAVEERRRDSRSALTPEEVDVWRVFHA